MTEQWQKLKETITELRDSNDTATQQEACKFLVNLMDELEKQISSSEYCDTCLTPCMTYEKGICGCEMKADGAVSKQAVLDAIEDSNKNKDFIYFKNKNAAKCFKRIIRDLPPAIPIENVGYWILTRQVRLIISDYSYKCNGTHITFDISCSNCGKKYLDVELPDDNGKTYKGTPYCPKCGAKILGVKMEGEE